MPSARRQTSLKLKIQPDDDAAPPCSPLPAATAIATVAAANAATACAPAAESGEVSLRLSAERSLLVSSRELDVLGVVGRGAYGVVERVLHRPSALTMAVKRIPISCNSVETKRMLTDLDVSMRCVDCPFAVQFFGALFEEGHVCICMELMDCSVDRLYASARELESPLPEWFLAQVCHAVVSALHYLHSQLHVIHRDVKPSNMLCNGDGCIKLCDFGIAGYLVDSVAKTVDAGCKPYMAPERIDPVGDQSYDIRSDVWSLGISLVELATGHFPYSRWSTPFDQLKQVVTDPPPRLPATPHGTELRQLVERCLQRRCSDRPSYLQLLDDPFIVSGQPDGQRSSQVPHLLSPLIAHLHDKEQQCQ